MPIAIFASCSIKVVCKARKKHKSTRCKSRTRSTQSSSYGTVYLPETGCARLKSHKRLQVKAVEVITPQLTNKKRKKLSPLFVHSPVNKPGASTLDIRSKERRVGKGGVRRCK